MFGESQYIERIIDQFTLKLYRDNPGPFEHSDGLYTYVYAIIMLNTDLHNVNMERKITL
jgi:Sec7-like guanine-nucleotide exchange factor